jgi:hypothetical protein
MWGRILLAVIPALRLPARQALWVNFSQRLKAGISVRKVTDLLHETPAFGVPTKYYSVGYPFAGVAACWSRHD